MREFLEEVHKHMDDGYGRAQKAMKDDLPKRFYKDVGVAPAEGGFVVTLDGRPTKTPGRTPVTVPVSGLATIMAKEWAAQGERIDPRSMPMVRLINSAVESGEGRIPDFRAEVVKYAAGDLMLYRAEAPKELVAEQEAIWDDALVKLARHFGLSFQPTMGIIHQEQPAATLAKLSEVLEGEGLLVLTALVTITGITGSGLLAVGFWHKLFTADHVWTAAHIDEDFQASQWGVDEEAMERRARRKADFDMAVKLLELMRG